MRGKNPVIPSTMIDRARGNHVERICINYQGFINFQYRSEQMAPTRLFAQVRDQLQLHPLHPVAVRDPAQN